MATVTGACSSPSSNGDGAGRDGGGGDPVGCPPNTLQTCPSPEPSWSGEVQAVVKERCLACHAPGGQGSSTAQLETYAHVYSARHDVASQLVGCRMPLADAGQLTDSERQALLGWLVCGAPDN